MVEESISILSLVVIVVIGNGTVSPDLFQCLVLAVRFC
jgi:hypothetical protein